jgi:hypothetical protein
MTTQSNEVAPMITSTMVVKNMIELVKTYAEAGAFEDATRVERELWEGVLEAVAASNAQAGWLATAALETKKIEFPRA